MTFTIYVNSTKHTLPTVDPLLPLSSFLRSHLQLTGTKQGCWEGGCGACTVLYTSPNAPPVPINACLKLVGTCDNCHILTTEGLGSSFTTFSDIQTIIADGNGSQCGFCTPGWVMAVAGFLTSSEPKTAENLEAYLDGNLCRCTGYRPILESFRKLLPDPNKPANPPPGCTGSCSSCTACDDHGDHASSNCGIGCGAGGCADIEDMILGVTSSITSSCCSTRSSNPPPAPNSIPTPLASLNTNSVLYNPTTYPQLLDTLSHVYKTTPPNGVSVISGNTGAGVSKYYNLTAPYNRPLYPTVVISTAHVPSLTLISATPTSTTLSSGVTLASLIAHFANHPYAPFAAFSRHVAHVANTQVRSAGTWAGNLHLASLYPDFPSDLYLSLLALDATITYRTAPDLQLLANVPIHTFVTNPPLPVAFIDSVTLPMAHPATTARRFKLTQRARNAHAHVNFFGTTSPTHTRIAIGGVTSRVSLLPKTALSLQTGLPFPDILATFLAELKSLTLNTNPSLLVSPAFLLKAASGCLLKYYASLPESLPRPLSSSTQAFTIDPDLLPVTAPVPKIAARLQASGEAKYTHDHADAADPRSTGHAAFVFSTKSADHVFTALPTLQNVTILGASDAPNNDLSANEKVFLEPGAVVPCIGAVLGVVVAATPEAANELAAKVASQVTYTAIPDAAPPIHSLVDAMAAKSTYPDFSPPTVHKGGDIAAALLAAPKKLAGRIHTGGQKHFYFETHSTVATPLENNCIEVRSSAQDLATTQATVAAVLGLPNNKVHCTQKRAGGGYGGKLARQLPAACAASIAAKVLNRSVALVNNRNADIQMMGGREPMIIDYEVGFDAAGKLLAVKLHLHVDSGCTGDSGGSAEMGMLWSDNAYNSECFDCTATLYKTNLPTNTSCRSPGNIQSCYAMEEIMVRISEAANVPLLSVQEMNFYKEGDEVPRVAIEPKRGLNLTDVTLQRCWSELKDVALSASKKAAVDQFNSSHKFVKRGMATVPVKYGINGAGYKQLVSISIYSEDGTIHVSHSGAEIGQGIDTKVVQCISYALGVDMAMVEVKEQSTFTAPNTGGTGGSATSEVVSQAALNACSKIMDRLGKSGYKKGDGWDAWKDAVGKADGSESLVFQGWNNPVQTNAFDYYVWCASQSVVELDLLTGECVVLSSDIQYDCGKQLNADVDIGQIEGAFIMGLGYFLTEKVEFSTGGELLSNGTWEYKPPMALDIPVEFNVRLLGGDDVGNNSRQNVLRSKATGEPPMVSSSSVWFAVRDAIRSGREEFGKAGAVELKCPATIDARLEALDLGFEDMAAAV